MKKILLSTLHVILLSSGAFAFSPTPNPHPIYELTCDTEDIQTHAYDLNKTSTTHDIVFFTPRAVASNPVVGINPKSLKLINQDGDEVDYVLVEDVGEWRTGDTGGFYFTPADDFNGTTSIEYTINNNCDYFIGSFYSRAKATVNMSGENRELPVIDGVCMFASEGKAFNDKVQMHEGEKMKTINVFLNDKSGLGEDSHTDYNAFIKASLRLLSNKTYMATRRVYVKNKGTWLANTNTGQVIFIPDDNFTGEAHMTYMMDSICSTHSHDLPVPGKMSYAFSADITVIAPTPTPMPTPCTSVEEPVCGIVNLCPPGGQCLVAPHEETFLNICQLNHAEGTIYLHDGKCKKITPTPTPCPSIKEPVCGVENICTTDGDRVVCADVIPKQFTYDNRCELDKDESIFIYNGKCKKPTPTPTPTPKIIYIIVTPTPTPTATPTPTVTPAPKTVTEVTPKEEPKPTTTDETNQTTENNNTQSTSKTKSSNGTAMGSLSLLMMMFLTGLIGTLWIRREEG